MLASQLEAAQMELAKETSSQSAIEKGLAEERAAQELTEQALKKSSEELFQELEIVNISLTTTRDKLASKSAALDATVILRDEAKLLLAKSEEKHRLLKKN
jgi:hypothetical protein